MFCSGGRCIPYTTERNSPIYRFGDPMNPNPCDAFYRPGIDYVYLPFGRARNDLTLINDIAANFGVLFNIALQPACRYYNCKCCLRLLFCFVISSMALSTGNYLPGPSAITTTLPVATALIFPLPMPCAKTFVITPPLACVQMAGH